MEVRSQKKLIRYAVIGLGNIAQTAVLPSFRHAKLNSVLTALVSGDVRKQKKISRQYGVKHCYRYDQYDEMLRSGVVDAVYIALPNHLHYEFSKKALKMGVHVLCEKPLTIKTDQSRDLIRLATENKAKIMTAYRLHFEPSNLLVRQFVQNHKIGRIKIFQSTFSFSIPDSGNIRLKNETGGGVIWDIGIYCVNAARKIFQAEPIEVVALSAASKDLRFSEVEETAGGILKFSEGRVAVFVVSFGAHAVSELRVVGENGIIKLENAFLYDSQRTLTLRTNRQQKKVTFPKLDQFAEELLYFSDCILKNKKIGPSGIEGFADVRIVEALYDSATLGKSIRIPSLDH